MFFQIRRAFFVVSLAALFMGTCLIATAASMSMGQMASDVLVDRIGSAGAYLFYPGMAGFVISLLVLLFCEEKDEDKEA